MALVTLSQDAPDVSNLATSGIGGWRREFPRTLALLQPYAFCADSAGLQAALAPLLESVRLAVDIERLRDEAGVERTALVQLSSDDHHVVLDPLAIPAAEVSNALGPLLRDPARLVVLHSAHNDLHGLWAEFGLEVACFLDTKEIATALKLEQQGLAALTRRTFGVEIDKTFQTADWSQRPIPVPMLDYASRDSQVLLPLVDRLLEEVFAAVGGTEIAVEAFARSSRVQKRSCCVAPTRRGREARVTEAISSGVQPQRLAKKKPPSTKFCQSTPLYGNISLLDPSGLLMCKVSGRKKDWYLSRNLAVLEGDDAIRLLFTPNGPGHAGNDLYMVEKQNRCAACGAKGADAEGGEGASLLRHFVVPACYRKHLPSVYKNHCPFDILLVCWPCKERANRASDTLKEQLASEHGAPIDGVGGVTHADLRASKAARVLKRCPSGIPPDRRAGLERPVRELLGVPEGVPLQAQDLETADAAGRRSDDRAFEAHGKLVLEAVGEEWPALVLRWRRHFVATMEPGFLPEGWNAEQDWREVSEVDLEPVRMAAWADSKQGEPQEFPGI